jgi:fructose/tagatose bisphosphate aldolase
VGEIGGKEGNSTVAEAVILVESMARAGLCPDLIAINNGTTHGNVRGEIDLELSRHTFEAMKPWGVGIAQHGTTGTPIAEVGTFYRDGIFKANVGTTGRTWSGASSPTKRAWPSKRAPHTRKTPTRAFRPTCGKRWKATAPKRASRAAT